MQIVDLFEGNFMELSLFGKDLIVLREGSIKYKVIDQQYYVSPSVLNAIEKENP